MKTDKYKRIELYLWWKCNQKCFFCVEMPIMEKHWNHIISNEEIMAKLLYFRKQWYNHVTFLWGEPTIQKNYLFALKIAKKLWYTVLVTTNALLYQFEDFSKNTLFYIDELILSIPCVHSDIQKQITQTKNIIDYNKVFENIKKYWKWTFIKINTVIHKKNIHHLESIFILMKKYHIKEISITYPEAQANYYGVDFVLKNTLLSYKEINFINFLDLSKKYDTIVKLVDIPLCVLGDICVYMSDDWKYGNRLKIDQNSFRYDRNTSLPRSRIHINKCRWCKYLFICWGVHETYIKIFWDSEINKI